MNSGAAPYRVAERFAELQVPTLLVWGKDDQRVILARAVDAARAVKDGYLVAMDRCRHEPHAEHPETFSRIAGDFLNGADFEAFRVGADGRVAVI